MTNTPIYLYANPQVSKYFEGLEKGLKSKIFNRAIEEFIVSENHNIDESKLRNHYLLNMVLSTVKAHLTSINKDAFNIKNKTLVDVLKSKEICITEIECELLLNLMKKEICDREEGK